MKVACLCPTYGRPRLVRNSLACFIGQQYKNKHLFILDDAGQIASQSFEIGDGGTVTVESTSSRYPSLPSKYTRLLELVGEADYYAVWDDDDVYLPGHLAYSVMEAEASKRGWSQPEEVWSDYSGKLEKEKSSGRFHGSLVVSNALLKKIGGWIQTGRADFDQQFIWALRREGGEPSRYDSSLGVPSQYIFRWKSTGHNHCQALMTSPENTSWYYKTPLQDRKKIEELTPEYDAVTMRYLDYFSLSTTLMGFGVTMGNFSMK